MTLLACRLAAARESVTRRRADTARIRDLEALLTHTTRVLEGVALVLPVAAWVDPESEMLSREELLRLVLDIRARGRVA